MRSVTENLLAAKELGYDKSLPARQKVSAARTLKIISSEVLL